METQTIEQMPKQKSVCNKEGHEQNKEDILKYLRERFRTLHKMDLHVKVNTGTSIIYFI